MGFVTVKEYDSGKEYHEHSTKNDLLKPDRWPISRNDRNGFSRYVCSVDDQSVFLVNIDC